MTEKLYYTDANLQEFDGTVLSCTEGKGGWSVVLDRTAFYPEGGGQPADQGVLGGAAVSDVREKDGEILHICDRALPVGERVRGCIDWARRFDHMQQHSGEHIISGIICARYGCDNVGFHMGHDRVTIDFNHPIPPEDLPLLEAAANRYIWDNHPINIRFLSGEALEQAEYRSKKFIPGEVRLVAFPGADCCACCGTHVEQAGRVGFIKLLSCQKFREGVRIEMAAGGRALALLSAIYGQNSAVSQALSARPMETAAAVARLQAEQQALRARVAALEETDFARKAEALAGRGDVTLFEGEMSPDSLRRLADAAAKSCGGRCFIFAGSDEAGYKYALLAPGGDLRALVKALNGALNGRGGGKPAFAQGSLQASRAQIEAFLKENA